eukprot:6205752-Pleurochrysis_carterae.AAC.4
MRRCSLFTRSGKRDQDQRQEQRAYHCAKWAFGLVAVMQCVCQGESWREGAHESRFEQRSLATHAEAPVVCIRGNVSVHAH